MVPRGEPPTAFDTLVTTSVKSNNWSGRLPILIACRLICDAPTCHNRRPQDGFIDLSGEIVYDKNGGMEWSKSGDKLACSRECQQQLQEPSGCGSPGKG